MMSNIAIGTDPKLFPEPHQRDGGMTKTLFFVSLPFSYGCRGRIGRRSSYAVSYSGHPWTSNRDTLYCPTAIEICMSLNSGHLSNKDTLSGPKSVHINEDPFE